MSLSLEVYTCADPDGHGESLALKGDWLVVALGDENHIGLGEASHSGNDRACAARIKDVFERHVRDVELTVAAIRDLERGAFAAAADFVEATAVSALDQALYELVARRQGVPVWRLFEPVPVQTSVPAYVTLNRALTARDDADYREAVERVLSMGLRSVKIAPFDSVTQGSDQPAAARQGLDMIRMLRKNYPDLGLRVDFHERFTPENALALLPELADLGLEWIEVPCPIGPVYAEIRERAGAPLAAGEFFFGLDGFVELARQGWADVVMPDVKHCGGFGPVLEVCEAVSPFAVEVSPHNPSGDVSTLATLQAACLAANVTSVELPLHRAGHTPAYLRLLDGGELRLPDGPGWGLEEDLLSALLEKGTTP
jgi:galactonate dehydratase